MRRYLAACAALSAVDAQGHEDPEGTTLPPVRRTAAKLIRYTPEELQLVTERARACGRPVACSVRECPLGAVPTEHHRHPNAELVRSLAQLGNRLTELRRVAAAGLLPQATTLDMTLDELLAVIRRID